MRKHKKVAGVVVASLAMLSLTGISARAGGPGDSMSYGSGMYGSGSSGGGNGSGNTNGSGAQTGGVGGNQQGNPPAKRVTIQIYAAAKAKPGAQGMYTNFTARMNGKPITCTASGDSQGALAVTGLTVDPKNKRISNQVSFFALYTPAAYISLPRGNQVTSQVSCTPPAKSFGIVSKFSGLRSSKGSNL